MKNIKREIYLTKIRPFIDQPLIKVLVGQRRVGKSFLMKQISDEILTQNKATNIIFVDKEKYEFDHITSYHQLVKYVKEQQNEG